MPMSGGKDAANIGRRGRNVERLDDRAVSRARAVLGTSLSHRGLASSRLYRAEECHCYRLTLASGTPAAQVGRP